MTYSLAAPTGTDLGQQPGTVVIKFGGIALNSAVVQWQSQSFQFTAARVDLVETVPATLAIVRADGAVQSEMPILFAPPQSTGSTAVAGPSGEPSGALAQSRPQATSGN